MRVWCGLFKLLFLYVLCVTLPVYSMSQSFKKLKILFVTDKFPYEPRQYINNQITGLIDRGHEVYILAQKVEGCEQYAVVDQYDLLSRTYYNEFPEELYSVDIIYCQFGTLGDYCLDLIKKYGLQAKLVVCFRGDDATKKIQENPDCYKMLFNNGHFFLPVCKKFQERIIDHGCPKGKVKVHHSGIDITKFYYKKRNYSKNSMLQIITTARLTKKKGLQYAIEAIAQVKKVYPNICYKIIGSGPQEEFLKNLIQELDLEKEVLLLGHRSHEVVRKELYKSHICLLPSITTDGGNQEGIPNSLMEAMATGMPVIGTDHSGISELIEDGVSGFLVSEKNSDQLAQKLLDLILHKKYWRVVGKAGRQQVVKEHDTQKLNDNIVGLFKFLLSIEENRYV